jgi:hypothetical protein
MPLTCVSNDAILKKPAGLNYSNPARTLPFTLNGAPFVNHPESIKDKQETVSYVIPGKPGTPATATSPAVGATADSIGYKTINMNTENIIGANSATTLKYENRTYTQKFIALHQGIWGDSRPHVSILLLSPDNDFFHICIPINLMNGGQDENLFLKYWLRSGVPPSGFTLNQILNFRGPSVNSVDLAIIQYCLKYNSGANTNPYTLCIFKTSLNLNKIDSWISDFAGITKPTFDKVLNYMLNGIFRNNDRRIVSAEQHFASDSTTATVPTPSFFNIKSSDLIGKSFELFAQGTPGKKLNNIKCYPIDLFNQIDEEGNIFIDEDSKKPVDIKSVNDPNNDIVKDSLAEKNRQQSLNNLSFIVVFTIVFGIVCILIIVFTVWFWNGKPSTAAAAGVIGANLLNPTNSAAIETAINISLKPERDALDKKRTSMIQAETDARLKLAAQELANKAMADAAAAQIAAAGTEKFAATRSWGDFLQGKPKTDPVVPPSDKTTRLKEVYTAGQAAANAAKQAYNASAAENLAAARQPAADASTAVAAAKEKADAARKLARSFPGTITSVLGVKATPAARTAAQKAITAAPPGSGAP